LKPEDIFGIIVRVCGLSILICAIWYLVYGIATLLGLPEDVPGYGTGYFISGVIFLIMGLYLLRGAPGLLRFAYPAIKKRDEINLGEPEGPSDGQPRA